MVHLPIRDGEEWLVNLLLELRSEEIPARMQPAARAELERLFRVQADAAGLAVDAVRTLSTPRRLALIADIAAATEGSSEERKGPRADAPDKAIEGFLRSTGLTRDQLEEREVKGQAVLFAVTQLPARPAAAVLAEAVPAIVRDFSWPKSMRWGAASLSTESPRWVRPLHGLVVLLDGEVVPCEAAGIVSGRQTLGHRVHAPGPLSIDSAGSYEDQLRAACVLPDPDERRRIIAEGAQRLAAEAGLVLVADNGLLTENVGLTEWPVPLLGRFDEASLTLPPEVIRLTARVNQKYFVTSVPPQPPLGEGDHAKHGEGAGEAGTLAAAFVCVANLDASDGGATIVAGNEKVLAARLSDARFFWDADLAVSLEEQAAKLDRIVFHEKLGTVADKVDRVAKLARWLVEEGVVKPRSTPLPSSEGLGVGGDGAAEPVPTSGSSLALAPTPDPSLAGRGEAVARLAALAERAARLCKADLVTGTVTEFPELQGIAGGHLAFAHGEDPQVAAAIRDHYKPVGPDDDVPTAPVTVAVSLADKLDTLIGFTALAQLPTGSKDPFALRRSAIGIIRTLFKSEIRLHLSRAASVSILAYVHFVAMKTVNKISNLQSWTEAVKQHTAMYEAAKSKAVIEMLSSAIEGMGDGPGPFVEDDLLTTLESEAEHKRITVYFIHMMIGRLPYVPLDEGGRLRLLRPAFLATGSDDLMLISKLTLALQDFVSTDEGADLLAGYKRAVNILKKEGVALDAASPSPAREHTPDAPALGHRSEPQGITQTGEEDPLAVVGDDSFDNAVAVAAPDDPESTAEEVLTAALKTADVRVTQAVEKEEWENAMAALASLRQPIDRFFEHATVNDPDPAVRERRLGLLVRVRDIMHRVADFSRIEG